jgi:peptidoglycan/xylan/chitin deacetylase (PgdA/CDA1 family)
MSQARSTRVAALWLGAKAVSFVEKLRYGSDCIRVLAYHGTGEASRDSFERQLVYLRERYEPAGLCDIASLLAGEKRKRPGIALSFDDGLYSNYKIAAPLLEKLGMRGLFFVPSTLPGLDRSAHAAFCDEHEISRPGEDPSCVGMSWDEASELVDRGHVIGCHTASHLRFRGAFESAVALHEIVGAKTEAESRLGAAVDVFAWVGGENDTYSAEAAQAIRAAGFRFAFTTKSYPVTPRSDPFALHRTMIDADMDFDLFRAKVAGIVDIAKARDRRSINRLIGGIR